MSAANAAGTALCNKNTESTVWQSASQPITNSNRKTKCSAARTHCNNTLFQDSRMNLSCHASMTFFDPLVIKTKDAKC